MPYKVWVQVWTLFIAITLYTVISSGRHFVLYQFYRIVCTFMQSALILFTKRFPESKFFSEVSNTALKCTLTSVDNQGNTSSRLHLNQHRQLEGQLTMTAHICVVWAYSILFILIWDIVHLFWLLQYLAELVAFALRWIHGWTKCILLFIYYLQTSETQIKLLLVATVAFR
jgi:hypothetical protein